MLNQKWNLVNFKIIRLASNLVFYYLTGSHKSANWLNNN